MSTMSVNVPPMSTPTRKAAMSARRPPDLVARHRGRLGPAPRRAHFGPQQLGAGAIHLERARVHDHAVVRARRRHAYHLVAHVARHRGRIALERIAEAARARDLMPEQLPPADGGAELGWQLLPLPLGIE